MENGKEIPSSTLDMFDTLNFLGFGSHGSNSLFFMKINSHQLGEIWFSSLLFLAMKTNYIFNCNKFIPLMDNFHIKQNQTNTKRFKILIFFT